MLRNIWLELLLITLFFKVWELLLRPRWNIYGRNSLIFLFFFWLRVPMLNYNLWILNYVLLFIFYETPLVFVSIVDNLMLLVKNLFSLGYSRVLQFNCFDQSINLILLSISLLVDLLYHFLLSLRAKGLLYKRLRVIPVVWCRKLIHASPFFFAH